MRENSLLNKLEAIFIRREEVGKLIVDPDIIQDMKRYVKLNKEYKDLKALMDGKASEPSSWPASRRTISGSTARGTTT